MNSKLQKIFDDIKDELDSILNQQISEIKKYKGPHFYNRNHNKKYKFKHRKCSRKIILQIERIQMDGLQNYDNTPLVSN